MEVYSNLFCLVHKKDAVGPGVQVEADEAVDVVKKMILDDGGVGEAHCERVHSLVESTFHQQKRVFSQQVRYRTGVAAIQQPPFVLQNEPVHLRIRREHRRLSEHVRREDRPVPLHALVDERLWIVALVRRYQLQRLADQRQAVAPRREAELPAAEEEEEEEDGEEDGGEREEECWQSWQRSHCCNREEKRRS